MGTRAWLYVRENECIWLEHPSTDSPLLRMMGPSVHREVLTFKDAHEVSLFIAETAERLRANGWSLQPLGPAGDRREKESALRAGVERRAPAFIPTVLRLRDRDPS
jgi:hypothetical protein